MQMWYANPVCKQWLNSYMHSVQSWGQLESDARIKGSWVEELLYATHIDPLHCSLGWMWRHAFDNPAMVSSPSFPRPSLSLTRTEMASLTRKTWGTHLVPWVRQEGVLEQPDHVATEPTNPSPQSPFLVPTGRLNVKNEELDAMIKEASGPINFTVFLTMFGEKLKGERFPQFCPFFPP